jgi:F-type H+-transporting ATPase subunit alpha
MHITDQVVSIYAGTRGHLDKIPLGEVHAWEQGLHRFVRERKSALWQKITDTKTLDGESAAQLDQALAEFQAEYATKTNPATVKA